jgi:hypothetical protein
MDLLLVARIVATRGLSHAYGARVDLFFLCAMVGHIMARTFEFAMFSAPLGSAGAARRLVHPGTLAFLAVAR